ncbi:recombination mediator RecR [Desulfovibrio litoralis]|uniref:Recombination protein RecR n=1 Tax=Desulfovibrio litoralis DSM 11393 TaxID=1121455 RepID=A0A1M7SAW1_9BACT|nr:recombination mediator RecR [Desulfovibrio litoralis]SHN55650.1 DNA replication and repair protein RecR [Desulfovibrio litoralis DSM 11393]
MQQLPEPLRELTEQLSKLPGVGPKSALRIAMTFLKWSEPQTRRLGLSIHDLRDKLFLCKNCAALSDTNPCAICSDEHRNSELLCIVAEWDSMLALEQGAFYRGLYLVLGGLLAPLENVHPDNLELELLKKRLASTETPIKEVILALGATLEAEHTASYLRNLIQKMFPHIKVTRLAQGIPLGSEVRFMDQETLRQSLNYRQEL